MFTTPSENMDSGQHSSSSILNTGHCYVTLILLGYGEKEGLTTEECMERLPAKFEALFPGPKPVKGQYELKSMSPYRIHQRCAETFRKGRVVLAGDAAHLCNPFGGPI